MTSNHLSEEIRGEFPDTPETALFAYGTDGGPAMSALNPRQRRLVLAWASTGGSNLTDCAMEAWSDDPDKFREDAEIWAKRQLKAPRVVAAIKEIAGPVMVQGLLRSFTVLEEIMDDPTHKDRLRAAIRIQEMNGFVVTTKHEIDVTRLDEKTMIAEIKNWANQIGMVQQDAAKLLAAHGVVDAEFTPVPETDTIGIEDGL